MERQTYIEPTSNGAHLPKVGFTIASNIQAAPKTAISRLSITRQNIATQTNHSANIIQTSNLLNQQFNAVNIVHHQIPESLLGHIPTLAIKPGYCGGAGIPASSFVVFMETIDLVHSVNPFAAKTNSRMRH
jgi:hypothetical protein